MTSKLCCWCLDKRPDALVNKYVDQLGLVDIKYIPRDIDYCKNCRQSQIPFAVLEKELLKDLNTNPLKYKDMILHSLDVKKRQYRTSSTYKDLRNSRKTCNK